MKRFTLISLALLVIAHVSIAQDSTDQPLHNHVQVALQSKQFTDAVAQIDVALAREMRDAIICSISRDSRYSTMKITPMPFRRVTNF